MIDELGVAHAQSVVIDEINLMTGIDKGPPMRTSPYRLAMKRLAGVTSTILIVDSHF
jgi:hypothetical protein